MYVLNLNFPTKRVPVLESLERSGVSWPLGFLASAEPGSDIGYWSAPEGAVAGDVCVIMCAKTAHGRMRTFVRDMCSEFGVTDLTSVLPKEQWVAFSNDVICAEMWSGMVTGWATLTDSAVNDPAARGYWGNQVYAPMDGWTPVLPGVSLLGMEPLIKINRFGGITKLSAEAEEVVRCMLGMG